MLYDEKSGWFWHKSWNIPHISVIIVTSYINLKNHSNSSNLYAQVFAAKITKHEKERRVFTDIGLKGQSRKEVQGGITNFTGLKFITTSFHHEVAQRVKVG